MVETIKHLFGGCGESHPNLLYLLSFMPVLVLIRGYIWLAWKFITSSLKNYLKRIC
jgi:hypothetical protein